VPQLPCRFDGETAGIAERLLLKKFLHERRVAQPILWQTSPRVDDWAGELRPAATVYDCSASSTTSCEGGEAETRAERALLRRADFVFAAGHSLGREKRALHPRAHVFPSPIDHDHFCQARLLRDAPPTLDQAHVPRPRLGYLGRVDSRLDLDLLTYLARARPHWQLVLVGPVVGGLVEHLPSAANLHYLGPQPYESLPSLMAGWDAALVPFALGAATRRIHPAKVAAYLAAGCPVVSTAVPDVVETYGEAAPVYIARTPEAFVEQAELALEASDKPSHRCLLPATLSVSWDETFFGMERLLASLLQARRDQGRYRASCPGHGTWRMEETALSAG
jgi:UDP-galactopyranose mutase